MVAAVPRLAIAPEEGRFPPGSVIAQRYRIVTLLGRGGMGEVYRATDLLLSQAVALKFLPPDLTEDEAALKRFRNEVKTARLVSHPNVCRVFDIGEVDGLTYLTMEYVDGEDLRSLLHRIGRLPQEKGLDIARKLCAGLAASHDAGVIHRDLKPANIMLDGEGRVRITDFGLASLAGHVGDPRSGTRSYMAPEQKVGGEVTTRTDIYALGLVLREVLTGSQPSQTDNPDLDPALANVIRQCLEVDPQRRPSTALAVSAALPGGDPIAMALAAGETPTPEMVAAAGESELMRPAHALACLALVLAGLAVGFWGQPKYHLVNRIPVPRPPDALAAKARSALAQFGYTQPPADTARSFILFDFDAREYLKFANRDPLRHERLYSASIPVGFWYREAQERLETVSWRGGLSVTRDDPPIDHSGMALVGLSPAGALRMIRVVPNQMEAPQPRVSVFDWSLLLAAAGADISKLKAVDSEWVPATACDDRKAWIGPHPDQPEITARFEAATWRGRPVYFAVLRPWTRPWRQEAPPSEATVAALSLFVLALYGTAVWIAWRNLRLGRGDVRGTVRIGALLFVVSVASDALSVGSIPSTTQMYWILARGLHPVATVCLFYLALEPYVRRRWPQTLISWSRLLAGKRNDPRVGRDVLAGAALGAACSALRHLPVLQPKIFQPWMMGGGQGGVRYLSGQPHNFVADFLSGIPEMLYLSMLVVFLLALLRAFLRRDWAAVLVLPGVICALNFTQAPPGTGIAVATTAFLVALFVTLSITRLGLVACMSLIGVFGLLREAPLTLDFSRWYAAYAAATAIVVVLVAFWSFKTALGGRRLFKTDLFEA